MQTEVVEGKLDHWKREQQLAGNGHQMTQSLENIQAGTAASWQRSSDVTESDKIRQKLY